MNRTESGIKAFIEFYGVINRNTINEFMGYTEDERYGAAEIERDVLGCSLSRHISKAIKQEKEKIKLEKRLEKRRMRRCKW